MAGLIYSLSVTTLNFTNLDAISSSFSWRLFLSLSSSNVFSLFSFSSFCLASLSCSDFSLASKSCCLSLSLSSKLFCFSSCSCNNLSWARLCSSSSLFFSFSCSSSSFLFSSRRRCLSCSWLAFCCCNSCLAALTIFY